MIRPRVTRVLLYLLEWIDALRAFVVALIGDRPARSTNAKQEKGDA